MDVFIVDVLVLLLHTLRLGIIHSKLVSDPTCSL